MVQQPIDELRSRHTTPKSRLFKVWAIIFISSVIGVHIVGAEPAPVAELSDRVWQILPVERQKQSAGIAEVVEASEVPVGISIPIFGLNASVVTPASASLAALDAALLNGVVHYPGSANPGEEGTVFLFGHSSGLPIVRNQNYKVFNRLKDLEAGDQIILNTPTRAYVYSVKTVDLVRDSEALVRFDTKGKKLVLSTCDNFGKKEDRYVVTADLVKSYPMATF